MLQKVLIGLLLLCLAGSVRAQAVPAAPGALATASRYTRDDTVRAIQHLYESRRTGGRRWLFVAASGVLGVVRVLANPTTTTVNGVRTSTEINGGALAVFGGVFLGLPVAVGVSKLARFSSKREAEAINAYLATPRPPRGFGRRLRRKDFR